MPAIKKTTMTFYYAGRKTQKFLSVFIYVIFFFTTKDLPGQAKTVKSSLLTHNDPGPLSNTHYMNTTVLANHVTSPADTQTPKTIDRSILQRNFQVPQTPVKFQVIKKGTVVRTETANANEIQLAQGEKLVLHPKKEIAQADLEAFNKVKSVSSTPLAPADLKVLPEVNIETFDSGAHQFSYQLYFFPYEPFTYNDSLRKFQSKMGFFFLRSDSVSAVNPIDPVNIIVTSKDLKQVDPRPLQINHLNFPASDVQLAGDNLSDSVEIRVITDSKPDGYQTFLKIKPILEISTNRVSLQGYGVQKIPVEVRMVGSNSRDSVTVAVTASKGTVEPNAVTLRYNSPQTIYLTSEGTGKILISAKSSNLESNDLHLSYDFPWYFLLAAILGGLLGGFANYYAGRKKEFSLRPIIGGILAGLVGCLAYYALGITLLNFKLTAEMNEFAVLALSALFAYFGIPKTKSN